MILVLEQLIQIDQWDGHLKENTRLYRWEDYYSCTEQYEYSKTD
jgi:hypothetical protein